MRRTSLACVVLASLLGATVALAGNPYFLDRSGVLWKGSTSSAGLVLTGERDGQVSVRTTVPFILGFDVNQDVEIQVAADELTGKVAVVWQRNWTVSASEIMMAVWQNGEWERIEHLSQNSLGRPRFPAIQLTEVATTVPDASAPDDPSKATVVRDSFLNAIWWEGTDQQQHASFASLRLTADSDDTTALFKRDLIDLVGIGLGCATPVPASVMEHPTFGVQASHDRALVLFVSQRICLLPLVEVRYVLDDSSPGSPPGQINVVTMRRRHVPIFGVRKVFTLTRDLDMEGTRIILGADLTPVAYRINGAQIEYVTATETSWSPRRILAVKDGLTLDQAIPLVENLAR